MLHDVSEQIFEDHLKVPVLKNSAAFRERVLRGLTAPAAFRVSLIEAGISSSENIAKFFELSDGPIEAPAT